ncbi:mRNA export factor Mex67p [Trichomonascus vanleenenianus]|uniref:Mex67p n=1 Tax=Trichomonascus vanleenenianus TaxID=2268995 RepID=UPI003ECB002B
MEMDQTSSFGSRLGGGGGDQVEVLIENWNQASREDLISFVNRKSGIRLQNTWIAGPILHAKVSKRDSTILMKYSGVRFAGQSLSIRTNSSVGGNAPGQSSSGAQSAKQLLIAFLKSRYQPETRMLNLQSMMQDPQLNSMGSFSASKMFQALIRVAEDEIRDVESVNLAANNLQEVSGITHLAVTYPNLKNLSLADNQISRLSGLESWRHKFRFLRELILTGNPITQTATYREDLLKMFPRLVVLDGIVVRDESQLETLRLPIPIKHTFFENADVQGVATNFLASYYNFYDTDRTQLLPLYDETSTFTVSLNSTAPRVITSGVGSSWSPYLPLSRNFTRITTPNSRQSRLYLGPQNIANAFRRLPATKHELMQAPQKFSIDVWRTTGVRTPNDPAIVIALHGEYTEQATPGLRSFDRTFVLLQGPNGNMIVATDMLTVRPYSGAEAFQESSSSQPGPQTPVAAPPQAAQPTPPPSNIPPELNGLQNEQLAVIEKLMGQTRLNAQYARMCAEQAGFDLQRALQLFQQSQPQLPPEAYV